MIIITTIIIKKLQEYPFFDGCHKFFCALFGTVIELVLSFTWVL